MKKLTLLSLLLSLVGLLIALVAREIVTGWEVFLWMCLGPLIAWIPGLALSIAAIPRTHRLWRALAAVALVLNSAAILIVSVWPFLRYNIRR